MTTNDNVTYREVAGIMADPFIGHKAADRETSCAEWLFTLHHRVAPCHRHVVDDPLMHVRLMDSFT